MMIYILHYLKDHGNSGMFLRMGNAGFISSTLSSHNTEKDNVVRSYLGRASGVLELLPPKANNVLELMYREACSAG